MSSPKRLRVAICGAGIGGLTLSVALAKYPDVEVIVYEQAKQLAEIGAGIGFFKRPWRIFQQLGLDEDLHKMTEVKAIEGPVRGIRYRKSDQAQGFEFYQIVTNGPLFTFHRADFQTTLLRHLPPTTQTHCAKRLQSYTQHPSGGGVDLVFEDGTTASCDVLIGADGVKSVVRKGLLTELSEARAGSSSSARKEWKEDDILGAVNPSWTGTFAYRALIPGDKLRAKDPNHRALTGQNQFLGKGAYVIAYPIQHGKMINFVAFVFKENAEDTTYTGPPVSIADTSAFASLFTHWEPEVKTLIELVEKPLQWAIHTVKPLPSYAAGSVCVMGDAAHAQAPHQGSGAGQAVEDAYTLSYILGHRNCIPSNVPTALQIFDSIRRPYTHDVQARARRNGKFFSLDPDVAPFLYDKEEEMERFRKLSQNFYDNWEWAWNSTIDDDLLKAIRKMDELPL